MALPYLLSVPLIITLTLFLRQPTTIDANCQYTNSKGAFTPLKLGTLLSPLSVKYKLYRYTLADENTADCISKIPILFIPGHCGGHGQVKDIAYALRDEYDTFSIDHNGEYGGFHGLSLLEQADFGTDVLKWIMMTRCPMNGANTYYIFGHSMGGIVARLIKQRINKKTDDVRVITFATAHTRPPITIDHYLWTAYRALTSFDNVTSIVNSRRDLMVDPDLSVIPNGVNINVESEFKCRPDHLQILRCSCVIDNLGAIMEGKIVSKRTERDSCDQYGNLFRTYGILIFAVGFQCSLFILGLQAFDSQTDSQLCLRKLLSIPWLTYIFLSTLLSSYLAFGQANYSAGVFAVCSVGPNYIFLQIIYLIARRLIQTRAYQEKSESSSRDDLLVSVIVLLLISVFVPFPYAFALIFLLMLKCSFTSSAQKLINATIVPLVYLQVLNAPGLLVWVKNVSIGWISFEDVDYLRAFPLCMHALNMRFNLYDYSPKACLLSTILLLTISVYRGTFTDTFLLRDGYIALLLITNILSLSLKLFSKDGISLADAQEQRMGREYLA